MDELGSLQALRAAARDLLVLDADPLVSDATCAPVRATALARYRDYVARFGPLNRGELIEGSNGPDEPGLRWRRPRLGGFRSDPDYHLVMALEVFDQHSGAAEPAPILLRRVHGGPAASAGILRPAEALAVARVETAPDAAPDPTPGPIDLERVARLLDLSGPAAAEHALAGVALPDPAHGGALVAVDDLCRGDVRAKLAVAREALDHDERYRPAVEALAAACPPEVGPLDIAVSLGAPWIDPDDVVAFAHHELGARIRIEHLPSLAHWKLIPAGRVPANRYGTARVSSIELLACGLNGRRPIVVDSVPSRVPGRREKRRNVAESTAAQDRLTALEARFATWVWEVAARTERLVADYNRRFNSHRPRRPDGAAITFPGLAAGVELWPWQRDVVARAIGRPATLCAHPVGAGKTRSMAALALTARRLGLARKPLVAVPAHLLEQTAREFRQAYPDARLLVHDRGTSRELAARCATGDWDAVIVSHGTLTAVPVAPAVERDWLGERIAEVEAQLRGGRGGRHGRALLRRRRAALEARMDKLAGTAPPAVTFDQLGVDLLLVDEAHWFKRLPVTSRREGISLGSSRRAADLLLKAQLLRARQGQRPSLVLFTGTPWSNTVAETFVWQTFVQPDRLAAAGIDVFDAWASVFVEYDELVEVSPDSAGFRLKQRPSRVRNLPELRAMLADDTDLLDPAALHRSVPRRVDDTVVCDAGPGQRAYVGTLELRADKMRRTRAHGVPGEDNMLALCGDGRRVALDPRLVGVPEDSAKLAAVADRVLALHAEHPGALQLVFCDQGTPGAEGPQTYGRLRRALVERGLPAERVRWVHEAVTAADRAALFAACRDGGVDVLLGSTETLGTGANVQTRLRAVHHVDAPWRPSDVEQREGRALRPGNRHAVVDVVRYVTRGTFDGYMWQTLERKARFVSQLQQPLEAGPGARLADDLGDAVLSYAEVKALATGNPLLLDEARAAADVARLELLAALDRQVVTAARADQAAAHQHRYQHVQQARMLRSARTRLDGDESWVAGAVAGARERSTEIAPAPGPVRAPWRGLGLELVPDGGWRAPAPEQLLVRITLAHRPVDELRVPIAALREHGLVVAALRRWVADVERRLVEVETGAAAAAEAETRAGELADSHRFDRAGELVEARARLALLRTTLQAGVDDLQAEAVAVADEAAGPDDAIGAGGAA